MSNFSFGDIVFKIHLLQRCVRKHLHVGDGYIWHGTSKQLTTSQNIVRKVKFVKKSNFSFSHNVLCSINKNCFKFQDIALYHMTWIYIMVKQWNSQAHCLTNSSCFTMFSIFVHRLQMFSLSWKVLILYHIQQNCSIWLWKCLGKYVKKISIYERIHI